MHTAESLKVLVACEFSGTVRRAFAHRGHDAWSCDLLPSEDRSNKHIIGDVREILDDGKSDRAFSKALPTPWPTNGETSRSKTLPSNQGDQQ